MNLQRWGIHIQTCALKGNFLAYKYIIIELKLNNDIKEYL